MSRTITRIALGATLTLVAGLGLTGPADAAPDDPTCAGQTAPPSPGTPPAVRPVVGDDTATVIPGGSVTINVLANDTHPTPVAVVATSTTDHGFACVNADGTVTYLSLLGDPEGIVTFTYGITDGYHYVQGTVTVSVVQLTPVTARVTRKLTSRHRATIEFTNTNARAVRVLVGSKAAKRPSIRRNLGANATTSAHSRQTKLIYVVLARDNGEQVPVGIGRINTRTGRTSAMALDFSDLKVLMRRWNAA